MNFILKYINQLFTPKFKPSEEDLSVLEHISKETVHDQNIEVQKEDEVSSNLKFLLLIYDELEAERKKALLNKYGSFEIDFTESSTYYELINEPHRRRISFLCFMIQLVKKEIEEAPHFNTLFISKLFNAVLNTRLNLSEQNIVDFFLLSNSNELAYFHIHTDILLEKIKTYSNENEISKKLIALIRKKVFVNLYGSSYETTTYKKASRILTNWKFRAYKIPFLLLPDYFGNKVNAILVNSEKQKAINLSEILQLLSSPKKEAIYTKKVTTLIIGIGVESFTSLTIEILKLASEFKPKLRSTAYWSSTEKKHIKTTSYIGMFEENLIIVSELLKTLKREALVQNISSDIVAKIAKRSYSLKDNTRLRKGTATLGNLCLDLLAYDLGCEGKEKLKELYNETTYKRVKKRINTVVKTLQKNGEETFLK